MDNVLGVDVFKTLQKITVSKEGYYDETYRMLFNWPSVIITYRPQKETLPKALRTQALTALTSNFGLVGLVWYVWFGLFGFVGLVF